MLIWTLLGAETAWTIERVVTVLVIACPHALGLAVPLVVAISTTLGARSGLLVRNRRGLEEARHLKAVVFDKTGTLTRGEFRVTDITTADSLDPREALRLAAAVERDSEHTIAQAIVKSASETGLELPSAEGFQAIPGHGVRASVQGRELYVGGPALLRRLEASSADRLRQAADRAAGRGESAIYLLEQTRPLAVFAVADAVRPEHTPSPARQNDRATRDSDRAGESACCTTRPDNPSGRTGGDSQTGGLAAAQTPGQYARVYESLLRTRWRPHATFSHYPFRPVRDLRRARTSSRYRRPSAREQTRKSELQGSHQNGAWRHHG
jgi:hypothetical protein